MPVHEFDVRRARELLGWSPRPVAETVLDMVASLDHFGLLPV